MAFKIPFVPAKKVSFRGSRPEVFCRKSFLRNFVKFTGKHLHLSPFLIKVAGLRQHLLQASKNTFFYRTALVAASVSFPEDPLPPKFFNDESSRKKN